MADNEPSIDRRAFISQCAGALACLAVIPAASLLQGCDYSEATQPFPIEGTNPTITIDVSKLTVDGQMLKSAVKARDGYPLLVVRRDATTFHVFSTRCPHQGFEIEDGRDTPPTGGPILCFHHTSTFDLDGNVIKGPATRALARYEASYDPKSKTVTVATG